jgi:hypothetical protein
MITSREIRLKSRLVGMPSADKRWRQASVLAFQQPGWTIATKKWTYSLSRTE